MLALTTLALQGPAGGLHSWHIDQAAQASVAVEMNICTGNHLISQDGRLLPANQQGAASQGKGSFGDSCVDDHSLCA